jgi:ABC-type polar amino acid transport system ATPase subunit
MKDLARRGRTMVVVTYELGHRVVFMDGCAIVEEGPAAQALASPKEARTREFLSKVV